MTLAKGNHLAKIDPIQSDMVLVTGEAQHRFEVVDLSGPVWAPDNKQEIWVKLRIVD